MFKNYLTIAIRNLARHKVYSFINIAGLSIGMACCALILLYIQHELSYDTFHSKSDRIYQVWRERIDDSGRVRIRPQISGPFASTMKRDFPEVEEAVRLCLSFGDGFATYGDKRFQVNGFYDVDPALPL